MARRDLPASFEDMCERYGVRAKSSLLIRELKAKRTERKDQARQIMTRAGMKMSTAEQRDFDRLMNEHENLDEMVTQAEERLEDDRDQVDGPGRSRRGGRGDAPQFTFTTGDGRQVPGVVHGESFARAMGGRRSDDDGPGRRGTRGEPLSLGRALVGMITGDRDIAEAEFRSQSIGHAPEGGFLVNEEMSNTFIDLARARSVISEAGAITVPLGSAETRIVRVTADPTATWKAEHAALNNTDVTFGLITMFPKVLGCVVDLSEELVQDARNAPEVIESVLTQAIADQLDRSLFRGISNGTGGNDVAGRYFTGILDDPNVNTVDMAGSPPADYDDLIDAMQLVEDNNGMADVRIESPRTAAQYAKLKEATTNAYLAPPVSVAALRHLKTTQVPVDLGAGTDESVSVVGNFQSAFVMLGIRSQFRIDVSAQAGDAFENYGRKVRIVGRADMAIGRPSHLTLLQAIGPTP